MKKSKWADWLVVIGFLGFLALALVVTLVRPKSGSAQVGLVLL